MTAAGGLLAALAIGLSAVSCSSRASNRVETTTVAAATSQSTVNPLPGLAPTMTYESTTTTELSTTMTVTRASFISAADTRCMRDNAAGVKVDLTDAAKTADMLEQTIAARTRLEEDLIALAAPPGDGAALTAFFEAYNRHLAALKDMQAAAIQGNLELTAQLARSQAERMQEMEDLAAAYGFSFCGRF